MGPAGAGKSTVGRALASALGWPFIDADDLHPAANIEKMRRGVPLLDADREPWLSRLHDAIAEAAAAPGAAVVACSALRQAYRDRLAAGVADVRWVYLAASAALLAERLTDRRGHFAGPELLASQLADLERPDDALVVPAALPVAAAVAAIRSAIRS